METGTGIGKNLTEIAALLIGVALIALLVGHAGGTASIIQAGTQGFDSLLQTVTLQNPLGGASLSSFSMPTAFVPNMGIA